MSDNDELVQPVANQKVKGTAIRVGVGITLVYFLLVGYLFRGKIVHLSAMELNSAGDFLAGFFAPLAFLWLVVSLWLQRAELRQNTEMLSQQLDELRLTVAHQGEIAWATKAELHKEKPYVYLDVARLYDNDPESSFEVEFFFVSSGGAIRKVNFEFVFHNGVEEFSVNEAPESTFNFRIYLCKDKYKKVDFNSVQNGTLSMKGMDVHGEPFKHQARVTLDFPGLRKCIEENADTQIVPVLNLTVENLFSSENSTHI